MSKAYDVLMVEVGHMSKRQTTAVFDYVDELRDRNRELEALLGTVPHEPGSLIATVLARSSPDRDVPAMFAPALTHDTFLEHRDHAVIMLRAMLVRERRARAKEGGINPPDAAGALEWTIEQVEALPESPRSSPRSAAADAGQPKPTSIEGEVGRCDCGASYYRTAQIGQPCEIQYCRGTVKSTPPRGTDCASDGPVKAARCNLHGDAACDCPWSPEHGFANARGAKR